MTELVQRYGLVVGVTLLVAVPLAVGWVAWRAARGARLRDALLEAAMGFGTAPWIAMTMTPAGHARDLQLVPFVDLLAVLRGGDGVVQLVGNLLVFAVLGALLPVRFAFGGRGRTLGLVAAIVAAGSVAIEVLQYAFAIGRVSSIDDVLLNAAGAVLAAACTRRWWRSRAPRKRARNMP